MAWSAEEQCRWRRCDKTGIGAFLDGTLLHLRHRALHRPHDTALFDILFGC